MNLKSKDDDSMELSGGNATIRKTIQRDGDGNYIIPIGTLKGKSEYSGVDFDLSGKHVYRSLRKMAKAGNLHLYPSTVLDETRGRDVPIDKISGRVLDVHRFDGGGIFALLKPLRDDLQELPVTLEEGGELNVGMAFWLQHFDTGSPPEIKSVRGLCYTITK